LAFPHPGLQDSLGAPAPESRRVRGKIL
jgi:hypothetical protein